MITNKTANELALRYYGDIYSFCMTKLDNSEDASDVAQEVFLFLQEKLETLEQTNVRSWLYCVANKKVLEKYRERRTMRRIVTINEGISPDSEELCYELDDYAYIGNDEIERIKSRILNRLTPGERELFSKIYDERKKAADIAQELGTTESAVRVRACRLRAKITNFIQLALTVLLLIFVKIGDF